MARFGLEMLASELKIREPAENPRPRPVHRAGRVAQHVGIEGEGNSCRQCLDQGLIGAPRLRAVEAPARDDEPHMIIAPEQLDDPADAFGRRQQPVEQRHPPGIPVNPVRAALGVHLENRVVAVEDPGPCQLDERAEIATEVRDAVDHRVWQPLGDLRLERLGAAFDQRDDEVVWLRDPDEPVLDVEPDLRVIDMGDDEYPGVRRRALKPRLLTIRRELWMRQQRTGSGYESAGWRHFGMEEPGGAKAGGGRARRQPFGQLPNSAASQANAGGETPQGRGYPPRRRGQEAFHLAPVLVCGRFQMRDPDEKRFVLVAQRIEKVVRLPHTHPRHFSQAFRCRSVRRVAPGVFSGKGAF